MKRTRPVLAAVLVLAGAGCQPASEISADAAGGDMASPSVAEAEILRLSDEFAKALVAGDVARLVAMYTADAVIHEPGLPEIRGEAAIRQHFAEMADFRFTRFDVSDQELTVAASGGLAVEAGYTIAEWEAGSGVEKERGPYVVVWRRQDGRWLIAREIFNSDRPAASI